MTREHDDVVESLAGVCERLGVACVVQVGAEDGYEADCLSVMIGCRAVAIDADPSCNPVSKLLEYHRYIIGATDCKTNFYPNFTHGLSSTLSRKDKSEYLLENEQQYRLDTFCTMNDIKPDCLIIDTEGTTLDVLEGCGDLLDNVKVIYAECQSHNLRPGVRPVTQVDEFLSARGFTQHLGPPSYSAGQVQGNYTWVRT